MASESGSFEHPDETGRSVYSTGECRTLLDRELERYVAKGWQIDHRTDTSAVIAKEWWGPAYVLMPLLAVIVAIPTFGLVDIANWPSGDRFKRRSITVSEFGDVSVTKMPSRGTHVSAYDRPQSHKRG